LRQGPLSCPLPLDPPLPLNPNAREHFWRWVVELGGLVCLEGIPPRYPSRVCLEGIPCRILWLFTLPPCCLFKPHTLPPCAHYVSTLKEAFTLSTTTLDTVSHPVSTHPLHFDFLTRRYTSTHTHYSLSLLLMHAHTHRIEGRGEGACKGIVV